MKILSGCLWFLAVLLCAATLQAAERIPPPPTRYFNDYTRTVSPATADALNRQLEQYERESSNQLLVAVFPKMESASSVEDYTVRIAQAWQVGQKDRDNGAVLFVFKDDRQLYIQVGYGLEATLTDAAAHSIVENILKPRFRSGDFDTGFREAVTAMIAATKGEYTGTGRTRAEGRHRGSAMPGFVIFGCGIFIALMFTLFIRHGLRHPQVFDNPTRRRTRNSYDWWSTGGGGGSGWSSGGGGGGGFSGGGGSFGGGGAGGKW